MMNCSRGSCNVDIIKWMTFIGLHGERDGVIWQPCILSGGLAMHRVLPLVSLGDKIVTFQCSETYVW